MRDECPGHPAEMVHGGFVLASRLDAVDGHAEVLIHGQKQRARDKDTHGHFRMQFEDTVVDVHGFALPETGEGTEQRDHVHGECPKHVNCGDMDDNAIF